MLNLDNVQTPRGDGAILIEPGGACWPGLLDENLRRLRRHAFQLAGRDVLEVRAATRRRLGALDADRPVIATGHQPAFVHPGVWAKHVVVHAMARRLGAAGVDLVVDSDSPPSSAVTIPTVGPDGLVGVHELPLPSVAPAGSAYEGRPALDPDQVRSLQKELCRSLNHLWDASPLRVFSDALYECAQFGDTSQSEGPRGPKPAAHRSCEIAHGQIAAGAGRDAVDQHLTARARLDAQFGADLPEVRVSDAFGGPFVADLLLEADRFADAYNRSQADERRRRGVRSAHRPLPDLGRESGRTETALWVYQPMQRRRRLWVERRADLVCCYADQSPIGTMAAGDLVRDTDAALAALRPWVVRPRALTLTLWARLLACDLFVHGIGGAQYDRITDDIIRSYYRCEPPAYACVSATLYLPLPRCPASEEDLASARRQVRDFRYNPDRYLRTPPAELLAERGRLIRESDRLRATRGPRIARRWVFTAIRGLNARLAGSEPDAERRLSDRFEHLARRIASNRLAESRDYFYALQPRERLHMLAARLVEATGLPNGAGA